MKRADMKHIYIPFYGIEKVYELMYSPWQYFTSISILILDLWNCENKSHQIIIDIHDSLKKYLKTYHKWSSLARR